MSRFKRLGNKLLMGDDAKSYCRSMRTKEWEKFWGHFQQFIIYGYGVFFKMEVRRHIRCSFRPISHQKMESITYPVWVSNHCCDDYKSLTYKKMWLHPCFVHLFVSALLWDQTTDQATSCFHMISLWCVRWLCKIGQWAFPFTGCSSQVLPLFFFGCGCCPVVLRCSVVSDSMWPPWTVAHQAPLSMGFPRHEYWSGLSFPPPGDLPDLGIEPGSLASPELAGGFFTINLGCNTLSILPALIYLCSHLMPT